MCLPPLKPHLQELLGGEDLAGAEVSYDPDPSPLHHADWIPWCTCQVEMPTWWKELQEIPSNNDCRDFAWKVHALFEVPKACNWMKGVDNDHIPPPAPHSLGKHRVMLPPDSRFSNEDYRLTQPCQTLTYNRVLQHWAERAQLPSPGELCHLVESVVELWWAMEPLDSFTDKEVFAATVPSNWAEISLPRPAEPALWDCRLSRSCQTHPRGSLLVAHGESQSPTTAMRSTRRTDQPTATKKADVPPAPSKKMLLHSNNKLPCPLPGFTEIAWPLWGNNLLSVVIGIPTEEGNPPVSMQSWDWC